jgi:hypothetical protein
MAVLSPLPPAAALAVFTAAVVLAFLHGCLHVLAGATRLAVFHFTLVFAATGCCILGIGVMAAILAVFHASHVVMTTCLGLRGGSRVGCRRSCGCLLRPSNQRQAQDQSKQSEFHKNSFIKVMRTVESCGSLAAAERSIKKKQRSLDAKNHSQQSGWRTRRNRGCLGSVRLRARRDEFGNFRRGDVS